MNDQEYQPKNNRKTIKCTYCGKWKYKRHIKTHQRNCTYSSDFIKWNVNERKVQCMYCQKCFNDRAGANIHFSRIHLEFVKTHHLNIYLYQKLASFISDDNLCEICLSEFHNKDDVELHILERHPRNAQKFGFFKQ